MGLGDDVQIGLDGAKDGVRGRGGLAEGKGEAGEGEGGGGVEELEEEGEVGGAGRVAANVLEAEGHGGEAWGGEVPVGLHLLHLLHQVLGGVGEDAPEADADEEAGAGVDSEEVPAEVEVEGHPAVLPRRKPHRPHLHPVAVHHPPCLLFPSVHKLVRAAADAPFDPQLLLLSFLLPLLHIFSSSSSLLSPLSSLLFFPFSLSFFFPFSLTPLALLSSFSLALLPFPFFLPSCLPAFLLLSSLFPSFSLCLDPRKEHV